MKKRYQPILLLLLLLGAIGWTSPVQSQQVVDCFPYLETFDGESTCSNTCGAPCPLTNGWTNDPIGDTQDWTVNSGGTTSGNTGPSGDHTSGTGNYIYLETSSGCSGFDDSAHVETPIIDASGVSNLSMIFWRHLYGATIDNLHIDSRPIVGGVPGAWVPDLVPPYTGNLDQWLSDTLNLGAFVGTQFQLRFRATSGSSFSGDMAIDDVSFITINALDAAVVGFTAPTNPVTAGPNSFDVDVVNLGLTPLSTFTLNWELNGVLQASPPAYAGPAVPPGGVVNVNLGTATIPTGNSSAKAWVSAPNGSIDQQACNDTSETTFCTPYSGTFTVGPGQLFTTPAEAADALVECGIDGPVLLNVQPGVYGPVNFTAPVTGASMANTIVFDGGDTSLVKITSTSGNTVQLTGADYVSFRKMTLETTASANGVAFMMTGQADFNMVDSCRIVATITTTSTVAGIVSSNDPGTVFSGGAQVARFNTLSNNTVEGGYYGIRLNGQSTASPYDAGNSILNNEFTDQYVYPVYVTAQDSFQVIGNMVNPSNATFGDGLYLLDIGNFRIENNTVLDAPDYGIYISDGNFDVTANGQSTFINNFASSLSDYAIFFDDVEFTNMYHNSSFGNEGFYANDIADLDVQNNVFAGTTYGARTADNLDLMTNVLYDYNVYWNASGGVTFRNVTNDYFTIGDIQAGSATNNGSSAVGNPFFVNGTSDLHLKGAVANDAGNNSVGVTVDADGDVRPAAGSTIVDIGADEYTPNSADAVGIEILSPNGTVCGDSATAIEIVIGNLGITPLNNTPIVLEVAGDITQTINYTYPDTLGFGENDTVIAGFLNTYAGGTITINGYTALAGDQDSSNDTLTGASVTFIPFAPGGFSTYGCGLDSVELFGNPLPGVNYAWYANLTDTVPVATGNSFTVPNASVQPTYFIEYEGGFGSLPTGAIDNNGCNGNMFDIEAVTATSITGFSLYLQTGLHDIEIWTRPGTHVGFENSNAGWTPLGSITGFNVTTAGITQVPITINQSIAGGNTQAFFIFSTGSVRYSNGTGVGNVLAQDPVIRILEGTGKCSGGFAGANNTPRNLVGEVFYGFNACSNLREPVTAIQGVAASVDLGADSTTCGSTPITLDATGASIVDYEWNTLDSTATITAMMSGVYSVEVTDTNGCTATDSVTLGIFADPTVNLGADTTICNGTLANLDAGNAGSTYAWNTSDSSQTIAVGGGSYSVVVTDGNGCQGSDSINVAVQTNTVALGADTTLCDGASLNLDAGSATTYSWSTTDTTQTINVSTAGTYSVTTTDNLGCLATDDITVATESTPTSAFSFSVDGTGLVFDFTYTGSGNASTFAWDFGDSNTSTNQDPTHTYAADGNYVVTLVVTNACGSDTLTQNFSVVGVENGLRAESINIFPNPNNGTFTYSFTNYDLSNVTVEMFTVTGQKVYGELFEQVSGTIEQTVTVEDISRGMYFLRFSSEDRTITRRVTVD